MTAEKPHGHHVGHRWRIHLALHGDHPGDPVTTQSERATAHLITTWS